ncbi:hypothetical protein PP568_17305 [Mycobacteroides abscessus]|uniref:Inorganic diphosphatase n=2 Tax=Mycobacteriaceae TaxID=1762 RepID=A0AB38CWY6_9MYCO|nr:hypothetical protein [Mycobacteroides abscessus]MBE5420815.1 hypothetical protein [Mycobacteroides abscessus]MBN7434261.1 hypothetical protein [Mycobacteroides abscessus subsp. abscessus]MBN7462811.1 hypothetical protein [Mycobacteroides abscessus subsp. abscessus]MBN7557475.1 hypothetical protein [Mycobacteroides abscessus subsp. abscessus]MDM2406970.1 hypothetical protein [Mycobacteroides abscessus]
MSGLGEQPEYDIVGVTALTPARARLMPECYGGYPLALLVCRSPQYDPSDEGIRQTRIEAGYLVKGVVVPYGAGYELPRGVLDPDFPKGDVEILDVEALPVTLRCAKDDRPTVIALVLERNSKGFTRVKPGATWGGHTVHSVDESFEVDLGPYRGDSGRTGLRGRVARMRRSDW